jgi:hypothetical protein
MQDFEEIEKELENLIERNDGGGSFSDQHNSKVR